ncbi:hypothetical protein F4811DRAFT_153447 [Daldinia bambusicola]|nr:hypothetical protein F4811DRAFT_153447 [Daldinia bambusicola]
MRVAGFIERLKIVVKPKGREREAEDIAESTVSPEQVESISKVSPQPELEAPKSHKGLRKPSVSSRRPSNEPSAKQNTSPQPTDYLYFGEGTSSAEVSKSLSIRSRSRSPNVQPGQSSITTSGTYSNPTSNSSGRDNSGFLKTGMDTRTSQMGYSSLTYGGSLQYDYAGTQAPGVAGFDNAA